MCGTEAQLYKTEIEGSILSVCGVCGKFGKMLSPIKIEVRERKSKKEEKIEATAKDLGGELIQVIAPDYSEKIKEARERLGLKQEDFAKQLNEKVSVIHQIETGHFEPNLILARKFEKALKIKLIEQHEEKQENLEKVKGEKFTIGDIIKLKKT